MAVSAWDTRYDSDAVTTAGHGPAGQVSRLTNPLRTRSALLCGPGGVVDDLVDLVAPAVVAPQDRPVLVGLLGPGGDDLAHQGAEAAHVLLGEGAVAGVGEVAVEEERQIGVDRGTSRARWPVRTRRSREACLRCYGPSLPRHRPRHD